MLTSHDAWHFHDQLVRRWFDASFQRPPTPEHTARLASGLGLPVKPWFEDWISFINAGTVSQWFTLRDELYIASLSESGVEAVSMLMQGEGDVFWCIDLHDWNDKNPEVKMYTIYEPDDSEDDGRRLYPGGSAAPFLASFALGYQLMYLEPDRLGPGIAVESRMQLPTADSVRFGNLQIWETDDTLVIRDDGTHWFGVPVQLVRNKIA